MRTFPTGAQWRTLLLLALSGVSFLHAQAPNDDSFVATLGELREAGYSDKATIVERLSQGSHPSVSAVLTAFMEDRLFSRNQDQKVFIGKTPEGDAITLIDPVSLKE